MVCPQDWSVLTSGPFSGKPAWSQATTSFHLGGPVTAARACETASGAAARPPNKLRRAMFSFFIWVPHRKGTSVQQAQAPIDVAGEGGQRNRADRVRLRKAVCGVDPLAGTGIEPLGPIGAGRLGRPNGAPRAALFEVRHDDFPVRGMRGVGPSLESSRGLGLAGRYPIGIRNQVLVPPACGEGERPQVPHLGGGTPLECFPHLDGRLWLHVGAPDGLRTVDVAGQTSGKETPVHAGAHELVVLLGVPRRSELVAAAGAPTSIVVPGVVRFPVQGRPRIDGVEYLGQIPIEIVFAGVANLVQRDPRPVAPIQ